MTLSLSVPILSRIGPWG